MSTLINKHSADLVIAATHTEHQRGGGIGGLGIDIRSVFNQKLHCFKVAGSDGFV